jgi:membrane protein required for colicin V production
MASFYVDIALLAMLSIFALLAFLKGFIRDFFSTINLVLAAIISYFLAPVITQLFNKSGNPHIIIDLGIRFVVFIIILIIFSIISSKIAKSLSQKVPDSVDQSMGFAFGFAKGYFIISFIFAVVIYFYSYSTDAKKRSMSRTQIVKQEESGPSWLRNSKSYDILSFGADLIQPFIDNIANQTQNKLVKGVEEKPKDDKESGFDVDKKLQKIKGLYKKAMPDDIEEDEIKKDSKDNSFVDEDSGYTEQEIKKMKRLIEIMSN